MADAAASLATLDGRSSIGWLRTVAGRSVSGFSPAPKNAGSSCMTCPSTSAVGAGADRRTALQGSFRSRGRFMPFRTLPMGASTMTPKLIPHEIRGFDPHQKMQSRVWCSQSPRTILAGRVGEWRLAAFPSCSGAAAGAERSASQSFQAGHHEPCWTAAADVHVSGSTYWPSAGRWLRW